MFRSVYAFMVGNVKMPNYLPHTLTRSPNRQAKSVASSHAGVQQRVAMEAAFAEAIVRMKN
jgi:hypothetical protein